MPRTAIKTASQIRAEFLAFFKDRHGHTFAPSSPVVPHDDPTLLFANAGMNQFKDVFLATGSREYRRAVNSQKCIRAGGKHNDLEDVGKDHYHHTFFEMLGNWSFGDYFKAEAIDWAWDLLVNRWHLDPDRLYATVFAGEESEGTEPDVEAEELWKKHLPFDRISRWGRKDNFWEMGETGPCGPCSEIHYDGRSDEERAKTPGSVLVNADHPDVIEIWNLVFIQFNRGQGGALTPLPARHVDTGMGFERVVRVIQGKKSNYDIDIWRPIFDAIEKCSGAHPYAASETDPIDIAYRVIADHIRCLTVAINDGAQPSNEGRGYVLRRILRRAVRHAHQTLGVEGPMLCDLVPAVVESLADAFPELKDRPERIAQIVRDEEESFLRTLDRGIALFEDAATQAKEEEKNEISAFDAFKLHDTYGFPIDLTRIMAEERGMTVDEAGYEKLMAEARKRSRQKDAGEAGMTLPPDALAKLKHMGVAPTTDEAKHRAKPLTAKVQAIWDGDTFDDVAGAGASVAIILNRTNHYAESGGQVGDRGQIVTDVADLGAADARGYRGRESSGNFRFQVDDTQAVGEHIMHIGRVLEGKVRVGEKVNVMVDLDRRRPTLGNHTTTHLLNHALRNVIGEDVDQRGSLVAPDRLRFDFASAHAMTAEQIEATESHVNKAIEKGLRVYHDTVPLPLAKKIRGLRAVFGERYPDVVRVVCVGKPIEDLVKDPDNSAWEDYSIELCGGTHLETTDQAGLFIIQSEQALAAGIRRIIALTGPAAQAADIAGRNLESTAREAMKLEGEALTEAFDAIVGEFDNLTMSAVRRHRITPIIDELRTRVKAIRKAEQSAARGDVVDQARAICAQTPDDAFIVAALTGADKETLLSAMDVIKAKREDAAAILFAPDDAAGKVAIAARVPKGLIKQGLKAGDWVREAAKVCGGGGGGRPDMAQAGGKDPSKAGEAMQAAREFAEKALS